MHNTPVVAAVLVALLAGGAHAASFDCKAVRTVTEKAICASPPLSTLDEQLAKEYQRALAALSPAGAAALKDSQRGWLHFATQVCTPRKGAGPVGSVADCLAPEFRQRLAQLAQAGLRVGPYVFNRIDAWSVGRIHDDDGAYPGFAIAHVAFPQIDSPVTPATQAWNAAQRQEAPGPMDTSDDPRATHEDDDSDYTFGCVADRFISLQVDGTEYIHGTPHGSDSHEARSTLLAPAFRKMVATDVFTPGSGWKARLPPLFLQTWLKGDDGEPMAAQKEAILAAAANPEAWLLTPAGLQIAFSEGEAGCHACNPGPITVPWSALKTMLAAPDIATCKAPQVTRAH